MNVEIRCYGRIQNVLGVQSVSWETTLEATVGDVLSELEAEYPGFEAEPSGPGEQLLVMVGGRNINHLDGYQTVLSSGDNISLSGTAMPE